MTVGQYYKSFKGISLQNRGKLCKQLTSDLRVEFVWRKQDLRTVSLS
jgi:hypothetical protein